MKHTDKNLNVLIPMAGEGSRFAAMGYTFPKPLIDIRGKPMIQLVVENLNIDANYIFIVQKEHVEKYDLRNILDRIAPGCEIVEVAKRTEGAACTALLAQPFIDNDQPLLIANCDQLIEWCPSAVLPFFNREDGGILTFLSSHPRWSYVKLGETGLVERVAEKQVISDIATVGIYYWTNGCHFVTYAYEMIDQNFRVNNEFYIAPVFNRYIADGARILTSRVGHMQGLGTPEDLQEYLRNYERD